MNPHTAKIESLQPALSPHLHHLRRARVCRALVLIVCVTNRQFILHSGILYWAYGSIAETLFHPREGA
jgi:hypothetical protein